MQRAPFVLFGTIVGLTGVLTFHSSPAKLTLGTVAPATIAGESTTTRPAPTTTAGASTPPSTAPGSPPTTQAPATTTTVAATGPRSATGPVVNYYFGTVSVTVNATGHQITKVSIGSLNDGGNPQSQYIDQQAIPYLIQQAMAAHGANIQGVSGASYTSAGFERSLQGALTQLGL